MDASSASLPADLPMPRMEMPVRREFGVVASSPGAFLTRSSSATTASRSRSLPLSTETGIGTSCTDSSRLRAVTTTLARPSASEPSSATGSAYAGAAAKRPPPNAAITAACTSDTALGRERMRCFIVSSTNPAGPDLFSKACSCRRDKGARRPARLRDTRSPTIRSRARPCARDRSRRRESTAACRRSGPRSAARA